MGEGLSILWRSPVGAWGDGKDRRTKGGKAITAGYALVHVDYQAKSGDIQEGSQRKTT